MSVRGDNAPRGVSEDVPAELGGWRLVELLGRGGMGEVWRGERDGVGGVRRRAAIKRILPSLRSDAMLRERFLSEARTSSRLEHPNIVQMLDLGDRPEPYLVFEFVEGVTAGDVLRDLSTARQTMPPVVAAYIAAEVATGLDYAHRKRDENGQALEIVHRDVSPHNVLISLDGAVKVTDFGVARARDNSVRTAAGMSVGKLVYMAPEQAAGERIDARADVFSLGVSLWEMLTCQPLLPRNDPASALQALQRCDFAAPSKVAPHLPPVLDAVVLAALARDPAQRYASAAAFAQALRGVVHSLAPGFAGDDLTRALAKLMPGVRFRASVPPPSMPAGVSARYPAMGPSSAQVSGFAMPPAPQQAAMSMPGKGAPPNYGPPPSAPSAVISQGIGAAATSGGGPVLPAYGPPASAMVSRGAFGNTATANEAGLRKSGGSSRVGLVVALVVLPVLLFGGLAAVIFLRNRGDAPDPAGRPSAATASAPNTAPGFPPVPPIPPIPTVPAIPTVPMVPSMPMVPMVPVVPTLPPVPSASAPLLGTGDLPAVPSAPVPDPDPSVASAPSGSPEPVAMASANGSAPPAPVDASGRHHGHHTGSNSVGLMVPGNASGAAVLGQVLRSHRADVQRCTGARAGQGDRVEVVAAFNAAVGSWEHFEVKSDELEITSDVQRCVQFSIGSIQIPGTDTVRSSARFAF